MMEMMIVGASIQPDTRLFVSFYLALARSSETENLTWLRLVSAQIWAATPLFSEPIVSDGAVGGTAERQSLLGISSHQK